MRLYLMRVFCIWSYQICIIWKQIYLTQRWNPKKMLPFLVWVDLRVMVIKRYSTSPISSRVKPHHQMQFHVILKTLLSAEVLPLCSRFSQYILSFDDRLSICFPIINLSSWHRNIKFFNNWKTTLNILICTQGKTSNGWKHMGRYIWAISIQTWIKYL